MTLKPLIHHSAQEILIEPRRTNQGSGVSNAAQHVFQIYQTNIMVPIPVKIP